MRSTNLNLRLSYFPPPPSASVPSLPCARTLPVIVPAWLSVASMQAIKSARQIESSFGKLPLGLTSAPFPLTPALSPGEREHRSPFRDHSEHVLGARNGNRFSLSPGER